MSEYINVAPTAATVLRIYQESGAEPDVNYAIAILAVGNGLGDVTIDRLRARLFVED